MIRHFSWDPLEDNIVEEFDDDGNTIVDYTTEPDYHGNVISQHRDGVTSTFHHDGLGSTIAVTNDAGDVTDTLAYTAFGTVTHRTGTTNFRFQFVGKRGYYFDNATNCHIIRRRQYSPVIGRFFSADLILDNGVSPYSYVRGRPTFLIDPSGLRFVVPSATAVAYLDMLFTWLGDRNHLGMNAVRRFFDDFRQQLNTICPEAQLRYSAGRGARAIGELYIANSDEICYSCEGWTTPKTPCRCLCDLINSDFTYYVMFDAGLRNARGQWIYPSNVPDVVYKLILDDFFKGDYVDDKPIPYNGRYDIHVPIVGVSRWDYGFYANRPRVGDEAPAFRVPYWWVTEHEICGHAWREHFMVHNRVALTEAQLAGFQPPGNRPQHDIAVAIEMMIALLVDPSAEVRPLFGEHDLHGESVGQNFETGEWYFPRDYVQPFWMNRR